MPAKAVTARDHEVGKKTYDEGEREILDSANLLADGFFQHYAGDIQELATQAQLDLPPEQTFVTGETSMQMPTGNKGPSTLEKALLVLMDVRDDLLSRYSQVAQNEGMSLLFTGCIRKIEQHMLKLGSDVEPFNPKKYGSGLGSVSVTNIMENAKKVVGNTQQSYKLYKLAKIYAGKASDGRPGIGIEIEGVENGKSFKIIGKIIPKTDFSGNEAIDYVKDEGKGIMSVKAFKLGQWIEASDQFEIGWQLQPPA